MVWSQMYKAPTSMVCWGFYGWLVVWNIWIIVPYIGNSNTNWLTHIFQRGRSTTNQMPLKFPLDPIKPPLKIPLNHHSLPLNHHKIPLNHEITNRNFRRCSTTRAPSWAPSVVPAEPPAEETQQVPVSRRQIKLGNVFLWCSLQKISQQLYIIIYIIIVCIYIVTWGTTILGNPRIW